MPTGERPQRPSVLGIGHARVEEDICAKELEGRLDGIRGERIDGENVMERGECRAVGVDSKQGGRGQIHRNKWLR